MGSVASAEQHEVSLLRFLTCGSVDDGKSTLIGRLLYDAGLVKDDHLGALEKDSRRFGTTGGELDFALLVDGLDAEREQGITIDVAYRFFSTPRRRFIVADSPGHEQYTRNMATAASTSDLAVLLVDARKGVLAQTRRHGFIASLFGVRHVILAVNKIDLVPDAQETYARIVSDFSALVGQLENETSVAVPISARFGDNVCRRSERTPWYTGPTLLDHLETIDVTSRDERTAAGAFRMPVQWVNRPDSDFRGFSGTLSAGRIAPGDALVVAGSARASTVSRIVTSDGDLPLAHAGDAVTLVLADEIDVSSGDLLVTPDARVHVSDRLAAHLLWMDPDDLVPGRQYLLKSNAKTVTAAVTTLDHKLDVATFGRHPAETLRMNDNGHATLTLGAPLAFDTFHDCRDTGSFILIDRFTNRTVGAGVIRGALPRASNVHRQTLLVDASTRAELKGQTPAVVWLTGLSGSGKSTIANLVERTLTAEGRHTYLLDGDNVRSGLCRDLGFSDDDRVENIRRVAEVAKLFVDAGIIVLASFISPFRAERRMARELLRPFPFVEVFVDTPLEVCEVRDPKGLYARARAGMIPRFTGIDSPYERPEHAEVTLSTVDRDPADVAAEVVRHLKEKRYVP